MKHYSSSQIIPEEYTNTMIEFLSEIVRFRQLAP